MSDNKVYHVLFLCTGNSARSIMAEKLMQHWGRGKFMAYSAGSFPTGKVNPYAIETLQAHGLSTEGLRSKSWDEFSGADAPHIDFIFTVCDNAAGEICPVWPGHPMTAHWGVEDPAAIGGSDEDKRAAFRQASLYLENRIKLFAALPLDKLDRMATQQEIQRIGTL
ncbi:arsenate reductase ArsC [Pseudomethylobacillus aquaticus]|uniref:Arsenate reductase ArsC n=1 Tax=Pseudomethylobacillus aquaticus TaxID=2676064 RepID=A0A3N0V6X1_9PROT|nr:arsenate reductase ArsC [Pseudomethylobacillus aquaticus]ROH88459.1 arsenate reductase ArsC [Pseudomethylobacillus aquaticus]